MNINKAAILIKKASLEFDKVANLIFAEYDLTASQYTSNDIQRMEEIFLPDKVQGIGMRDFVFRDGRMGLK